MPSTHTASPPGFPRSLPSVPWGSGRAALEPRHALSAQDALLLCTNSPTRRSASISARQEKPLLGFGKYFPENQKPKCIFFFREDNYSKEVQPRKFVRTKQILQQNGTRCCTILRARGSRCILVKQLVLKQHS